MEINFSSRECNVKIVYYGPGLSGKTTNLEIIHQRTPIANRGNLTALATDLDRTLYFDYMPLELGKISSLTIRMRLFTVPGQVYYNSTRKLVLRCVDGIVFIADSQFSQREANKESLLNLEENLQEQGISIEEIPIILQHNKRDLPDIMPIEMMEEDLNSRLQVPCFPAVAFRGDGVFQCLKSIANLTMGKVEDSIRNRMKSKEQSIAGSTISKDYTYKSDAHEITKKRMTLPPLTKKVKTEEVEEETAIGTTPSFDRGDDPKKILFPTRHFSKSDSSLIRKKPNFAMSSPLKSPPIPGKTDKFPIPLFQGSMSSNRTDEEKATQESPNSPKLSRFTSSNIQNTD